MKLHNTTDRIEKEIVLRAPQSRVWGALANAEEFGAWFGMKLEGDFAPGGRVRGQITLPGHGRVTIEIAIELDAEPGAELFGVGKSAPNTRAGCAQNNLFLDAVRGVMQLHGCILRRPR